MNEIESRLAAAMRARANDVEPEDEHAALDHITQRVNVNRRRGLALLSAAAAIVVVVGAIAFLNRDDGKNPDIVAKVLKINVWYAQQVAYLARALARLPAAEGTVLDNSLVVWGNELATGPHTLDDIPVVLLGKAAGRLKSTGLIIDQGLQDYHRLGTSLLNVMGVPATGLGEAPDCGLLQGLTI